MGRLPPSPLVGEGRGGESTERLDPAQTPHARARGAIDWPGWIALAWRSVAAGFMSEWSSNSAPRGYSPYCGRGRTGPADRGRPQRSFWNWPILSRKAALLGILGELLDERLHRLDRLQLGEAAAEQGDAGEGLGVEEALFLAGARLLDVDRRPDAAVGQLAVEDDLHVAGPLELLEDQLVHPAAGLDQAVARTVSEPPSSNVRAAPKSRLGTSSALMSMPPDIVRPEFEPLL